MTEKDFIIRDRMRFKNNKLSARLAYLAIATNVLYFILVFRLNDESLYKTITGVSVLYNLVFLLAAFLCSEGAKNYKLGYSIALFVLAVGQIARIFILPPEIYSVEYAGASGEVEYLITEGQHIRMIAYLALSAAFALAAGVIGVIRTVKLKNHLAFIKKSDPKELIDYSRDEVVG